MISAIELALTLLSFVLDAAHVQGTAPDVIKDIETAVAALAKVHGTDVTFEQLESLRIEPKW